MGKAILGTVNINAGAQNADTTYYHFCLMGHIIQATTTESNTQRTFRTTGILSNLYMRVISNDRTTASTGRTRINGGNGNQSISIGSSTTGEFEDTVNRDPIYAGNNVNLSLAVGTTGTVFNFITHSVIFKSNKHTITPTGVNGQNFTTASTTQYFSLSGSQVYETDELQSQEQISMGAIAKNMFLNITTNSRTTTTTYGLRKNTANGNLSISVSDGSTGFFEDNTNTDTIAAGNLVNFYITTGTGTEIIVHSIGSVEIETVNNSIFLGGYVNESVSANVTAYFNLLGGNAETTTQVNASMKVRISLRIKNIWVYVSANTVVGASTFTIMNNFSAGNNSISIGSLATGEFEDASNLDVIYSASQVSYRIITGATGTSMVIDNITCVGINIGVKGGSGTLSTPGIF